MNDQLEHSSSVKPYVENTRVGALCLASRNLRSFKEKNCGDAATLVGGASHHSHLLAAGLSEGLLTCCAHGVVLGGGGDRG